MNHEGWIPSQVLWRDSGLRVLSTLLGRQRLLEPFFESTIQLQMMHPFHALFRREISIEELAADEMLYAGAVPLRGMIFHMSRCGSTLISQMLAASERNIVASEPPPLDAIVRAHMRAQVLDEQTQIEWMRAMAAALGQPRAGGEQAFYIKMDCWHIHQVDLIRAAFPHVPFVFLYRDPLEVTVSQQRSPAAWTVPGLLHPANLQLEMQDWQPQETDVYRTRVLANICQSGLYAAQHCGALLVNYSELPEAMYGRLFKHLDLSAEDMESMRAQASRDAKSPARRFTPDAASKRAEATDRIRQVVEQYLAPIYSALEQERQRQLHSAQ
jgi:hypothetical protein